MDNFEDRRQYERILFSSSDNIKGTFTFPDFQDQTLEVNVMNIGEGGLCCSYKKDPIQKIKKGDRLILRSIDGYPPLAFLMDVDAIVRWCFENDFFDHIEFGIEFMEIDEEQLDQLQEFVESWDEEEEEEELETEDDDNEEDE